MRPILFIPLSYFCCLWFRLFFTCSLPMAYGEYYSSVDSLKILGNMEATLIDVYKRNLKAQKQDIKTVQRFIKDIKFQHELAKKDIDDYIENPINAFILIKRMVNDWRELFQFLEFHYVKMDIQKSIAELKTKLKPLEDDELKGAVRGLLILQTIYKLNATELANGKKYGNSMDWNDCFEIGATSVDYLFYNIAIDWLMLSLSKLRESEESNDIKIMYTTHIKEYMAFAYQGIGNYKVAIQHLEDILEYDAESNVKLTRNAFLKAKNYKNDNIDKEDNNIISIENHENYAKLCRGEHQKQFHPLYCKLEFKLHPFFMLNPLQVEPLLLDPPIYVYHNLINDKQISELLRLTQNNMQRSEVYYGNESIKLDGRVSQQAGVAPEETNISKMMYRIVAGVTGFDMNNAEYMQVANYGIGGQYVPHFDFLGDIIESQFVGDRIATNMFYLSDVEEGGYTVFPELDVYVKPTKGSMVMWFNLHKSLKEDERTLHGGCPVLKGSKIIANIWTHSGFQEFRRPCDLINDSV